MRGFFLFVDLSGSCCFSRSDGRYRERCRLRFLPGMMFWVALSATLLPGGSWVAAQTGGYPRSSNPSASNAQQGNGQYAPREQSSRYGDRPTGVQTTVSPPGYAQPSSSGRRHSNGTNAQTPTLQRAQPRSRPPANARAPFMLSPHQQAELDRFLDRWEEYGEDTKRFECEFNCLHYRNAVLPSMENGKPADPNAPSFTTFGKIKYASPDKGLYEVSGEWIDGKPVGGQKRMKLICNGEAVFEYKFGDEEVVEFPLSEEQKGNSIQNGPLPFVFGAKAEDLKQRYFLRLITPAKVQGEQIWLEVWPRWREDADEFLKVQLILDSESLKPIAMQKFDTNGKTWTVYQFLNVQLNNRDLKEFLLGDPFTAKVPFGWKKRTDRSLLDQRQVGGQPQKNSSYR